MIMAGDRVTLLLILVESYLDPVLTPVYDVLRCLGRQPICRRLVQLYVVDRVLAELLSCGCSCFLPIDIQLITSVRADSSILERQKIMWSQNHAHRDATLLL